MTTLNPSQLDDQALRVLLRSVIFHQESGGSASNDYLEFLEGQVATEPWNNEMRQKLEMKKKELQAQGGQIEQNIQSIRKLGEDPRLAIGIREEWARADWQGRVQIAKGLGKLGGDWAVGLLKELGLNDQYYNEKSDAPDHYTDPDMVARFGYTKVWPIQDAARESLRRLGK